MAQSFHSYDQVVCKLVYKKFHITILQSKSCFTFHNEQWPKSWGVLPLLLPFFGDGNLVLYRPPPPVPLHAPGRGM